MWPLPHSLTYLRLLSGRVSYPTLSLLLHSCQVLYLTLSLMSGHNVSSTPLSHSCQGMICPLSHSLTHHTLMSGQKRSFKERVISCQHRTVSLPHSLVFPTLTLGQNRSLYLIHPIHSLSLISQSFFISKSSPEKIESNKRAR